MNWLRHALLWAAAFAVGLLIGRTLCSPRSDAIVASHSPAAPKATQATAVPTSRDFQQLILAGLKDADDDARHLPSPIAITLRRWAESDFDGALAFAKSLSPKRTRSLALGTVLAARADADTSGTMKLLRELMKPHGDTVFYAFFHEWARTNRAAALRFADAHPGVDAHYLGGLDLLDLDGMHPAALTPLIASLKRDEFRQSLINYAVRYWPESDLAGMIAFQNAMPTPQQRTLNGSFYNSPAFNAWVKSDPVAASNAVATLRSEMIRNDAWDDIARTVLDDTRYEGVKALLYSPHADAFTAALTVAMDSGAAVPVADALLSLLPESAEKQALISKLAQKAADNFDAASAQALLNRLPEGQGGEVFAKLAENWFRADPVQAAAWLDSLAAGSEEHSWAQAGAVRRLAPDDLHRAIPLAETIGDPAARKAAITDIARTLGRLSTPAQRQWLEQRMELSPIERMEWLSGGR